MAAILVLTGASGSGKTTILRAVEAIEIPAVACFQCDTIYHGLPEEVRANGEVAQDAILDYWVQHALGRPAIELAVLETQIRPHKALAMLGRLDAAVHQVVLVECEQAEREARLRGPRAQPELANQKMENWAAYMRGQADALALDIINTSGVPISALSGRLRAIVESLLKRTRGAPADFNRSCAKGLGPVRLCCK
jgi:energy-coupling factor transporter ATP-binding protein EcfA2